MMKKKGFGLIVACITLMLSVGSFAASIDLSGAGYNYDIAADGGNVKIIYFEYDSGGNDTTVNFRRLKPDTSDGWMMPMDITSTGLVIDSDYGPYSCSIDLTTSAHVYVFTMNSSNGLWSLAVDGSDLDFVATGGTTAPQPDGTAVVVGSVITDKFFSDETAEAMQNAIDLGWTANAGDGVGSAGAYRIKFEQASGSYVDNIGVISIPEPATMALLGLGGLALIKRKRS